MTYATRTAQQYEVGGALLGDVDPATRVSYFTEFAKIPMRSASKYAQSSKSPIRQYDNDWVISGRPVKGPYSSNGAMWDVSSGDGWLRLGISSKSTKSGNLFLRLASNQGTTTKTRISKWASTRFVTDDEPELDVLIKTSSVANHITKMFYQIGFVLTHTYDVTVDQNCAKFWFNPTTSTTNLYAVTAIGAAPTLTDTGVDLAVSTIYRLQIRIGSDRTAKFYVNGALVHTSLALTTAISLRPHIGIKTFTGGTTGRGYMYVGYVRMSKIRS